MYLLGKRSVWTFREADKNIERQIRPIFPAMQDFPVTEITFELMYWRKANHIHRWFVENVQHGVDDCGEYQVSREQLSDLSSRCVAVLNSHEQADQQLPTLGGFFFGGTTYDQYYFDQLRRTRDGLDRILTIQDDQELVFSYHSSW